MYDIGYMKRIVHKARHAHRRLVTLPVLALIVLIAASGYMSVRLLRHNNLTMVELRQAVVDADALGDKALIEQNLQFLQHYVSRHMNTSTKLELRSSYQRDAQARQQEAAARLGNVELYRLAESDCLASGVSGAILAECINERLTGQAGNIVDLPDARLYRYAFVAPYLSLDLAGLTIVIFGIFVYAGCFQLAGALVRYAKERLNKNPSA